MNTTKVAIYGVFNSGGQCFYIGRSKSPLARFRNHKARFPDGEGRILLWVDEGVASREEKRQIAYYKSLNQATENKTGSHEKGGRLIRLTPQNEAEFSALVKDAKLEFLTVSKAVNAAAENGLAELRRLWVKPKKD